MVIQWQSRVNPVYLEFRPQCTLECHWRKNWWKPVCFQCVSSGLPVEIQCVPTMQINTGLPLGYHWVLASASVVPVASRVLVAPVVFQCVPIMQINIGWPLEDHWAIASASVVPVQSVQWYPSVVRASGLEVIRSGNFPTCIQLVWRELFDLSWFHYTATPNTQKL